MERREDPLKVFKRAFAQEDYAEVHQHQARMLYSVADFILNREFYGGSELSRGGLEHRIIKSGREMLKRTRELKETVNLLVLRCFHEEILIYTNADRLNTKEDYRTPKKFRFKTDNDSKAKYLDLIAYFGEQAGIDSGKTDDFRRKAEILREKK